MRRSESPAIRRSKPHIIRERSTEQATDVTSLAKEHVRVEKPMESHVDWDSWLTYVLEYAARTYQMLSVAETMSAEERNKRIARTKKGTSGKIAMMPAAFDPYQRVYICTHGLKKRKGRSRSKVKRPY
ncbi:hypothetical protein BBJ28_00019807, partial [Nothophytophthora sp. Chile5]